MDISALLAGKKQKPKPKKKQKKKKKNDDSGTASTAMAIGDDNNNPINKASGTSASASTATTTRTTDINENELFESLGTTKAETSTYESDVIRQATLKLAPKLRVELPQQQSEATTSASSSGVIKFPDFITETSLLPFNRGQGNTNKANRQVVLKVLQKLQAQMKDVTTTDVDPNTMRLLAMKQNMLLSMLGQHSKRPDIQQVWKEQTQVTLNLYQQIEQQQQQNRSSRKRISMMERKQLIPGAASLAKAQQQQQHKRAHGGKKGWKDWSSDEESDEDAPKTRPVLPEMNYSRRRMARANGKTLRITNNKRATRSSGTTTRTRRTSAAKAGPTPTPTPTPMTMNKRRRRNSNTNKTASASVRTAIINGSGDDDDDMLKREQNSSIMELDLRNIVNDEGHGTEGRRPKRQNRTKVTSYAETENDHDIEEEMEIGQEQQQQQDKEENSEETQGDQEEGVETKTETTIKTEPAERTTFPPPDGPGASSSAAAAAASGEHHADKPPPPPTTTTTTTTSVKQEPQKPEKDPDGSDDAATQPTTSTTTTTTATQNTQPTGTTTPTTTTPTSESITCPLCQKTMPLSMPSEQDDANDPSFSADSQLAQHMAECQQQQQQQQQASSLSSRRSSRRTRNPLTNGSYKEVEDDDDDDLYNDDEETETEDEEEAFAPTAAATSTKRGGTSRKRKRSSTTETAPPPPATATATKGAATTTTADNVDDENMEEGEDKTEDVVANADNDQDDDKNEQNDENDDDQFVFDADEEEDDDDEDIPLLKPTSIDDYLLDDYEDRIDYWRLYGISEMRDMSRLRAEGEVDPGPVTLEGGLHIPGWMNNRLFGYQRTGLEWMWSLHQQQAGGVMGDEMGLGKTVQVSSFLGAMAASRQLKGVLIISPATMLQHWLSELAVWAPGLRRVLLHSSGDSSSGETTTASRNGLVNHGPAIFRNLRDWLKLARKERLYEKIGSSWPGGDGDNNDEQIQEEEGSEDSLCGTGYAIVTTYEHVRRNQDDYVNHPWSYVVMDEAQKIRNPTADITLSCKRLRTPHRIAMTGTPIQNDLKELWSLFDFVFPGRLGTLPAFEEEFAGPIKRGGYSNASPVQVQLAYRCSLVLRDLIDPYLLRRQKAEIDEVRRMPSKTEHVLFCRLSKRQRSMYESFLKSDMVKKIYRGSTLLFAAITMMRKICNHPDLILPDSSEEALEAFLRNGCAPEHPLNSDDDGEGEDEDEDDYDPFPDAGDRLEERSGKFQVMAKILPLWKKQGHRVLIFSQWTKMLNIIQQFVVAQGWKFLRLDGKTNVASRQKLVDQFNSDKSYFGMLCTTRTGGVGLNLTGANKLVLYDVDWNPQTDAQARERAWRFGQEKQVTVYRLCTAGTIEEKMYQRQIFKTALTNKVLHDPRQKRLFSQKDLHDLLTLQPDNGKASTSGGEDTTTIETTERLARASRKDEGVCTVDSAENLSKDDGETLASVLKSKGLAGVFDHNFVDPSASGGNKSQTAREMEEQAKQIAREAAEALKSSVDTPDYDDDPFTPTWTGAPESRFGGGGGSNGSSRIERRGSGSSFGSAGTAGVRNTSIGGGLGGGSNNNKSSSGSLLASIRQRNEAIKSGGASNQQQRRNSNGEGDNNGKNSKYTKLLVRIRDYVRNHSPTSDEILDAFASVPDCDAAIFKRLLNSVAKVEDGRWQLLPDHG